MPYHTMSQTRRLKRAFLESYERWANISEACRISGAPRASVYVWQENDLDFAAAMRIAGEAATERLEREAWRRATEGTPYKRTSYWHGEPVGTDEKIEYSDTLLLTLLKARRPETYRDNASVTVTQIVKTVAGVDPASVL